MRDIPKATTQQTMMPTVYAFIPGELNKSLLSSKEALKFVPFTDRSLKEASFLLALVLEIVRRIMPL